MTPPDTPEEKEIEVLVRKDRENLNSFVENLNRGVGFDDLDEDLQGVVAESVLTNDCRQPDSDRLAHEAFPPGQDRREPSR